MCLDFNTIHTMYVHERKNRKESDGLGENDRIIKSKMK